MVCNDHSDSSYLFYCSSGFMQYYQTFHLISRLFYPLKKLFPDINEDFFYTCILGFFCGCPLGAKIIDDFISCGSFTKSEGEKLLYTCNQISPMFSAGYTLTLILHGKISALRFFFCLYFPVMCYLIYLIFLFFTSDFLHTHHSSPTIAHKKSADQVIFDSLHSIFMIGICIMIFSIAVSLLEILPLPFYLKRGLTAVLESHKCHLLFWFFPYVYRPQSHIIVYDHFFWRVVCCRADFKCIQKEQTLPLEISAHKISF